MSRLLLVDDDVDHLKLLSTFLTVENYTVVEASDGATAKEWMLGSAFDLIILDWTLPDIPGIELCRIFRQREGATPILFLTGKTDIVDKEEGFSAGADDYLTKPFDVRELLMRIKALLRRPRNIQSEVLTARGIAMDTTKHEASIEGKVLTLTRKEFALLEVLMRNPHQVFSHDKLLDLVWANDADKSIDVVRQTVARVRSALSEHSLGKLIRTVHGVGYRLEV